MSTRTYQWNWSTVTGTKNDGQRIKQSSSSLTSRTLPSRGSWDVDQLSAIHVETLNDVGKLFSQWNTMLQPILKSLPAGGSDTRWGGLRQEIDALSYGIDGTTLFVFQDASPNNFDGRYWHTTDTRPFTISEVIEDHDGRIGVVESNLSTTVSGTLFDDTDLWTAIGYGKKPGSVTGSATDSLHGAQIALQDNVTKLAKDLYGVGHAGANPWPSYLTTWGGAVLAYGIHEYLSYLTDLHGVDMGAGQNPWDVAHAGLGAHTHPQIEVDSSGLSTRDRSFGLSVNLEDDLKRIRYEIGYTRGSNWNNGTIVGPFITNYPGVGNSEQTVLSHINFIGNIGDGGTLDSRNPHRVGYMRTGAGAIFDNVGSFTGMTTHTDASPTYLSINYVTQGASLETTIGELDAAMFGIAIGTVVRGEYDVDRSAHSETWREQNPIVIYHGAGAPPAGPHVEVELDPASFGKIPLINVLDMSPESEDMYGMYSSWNRDANVVHPDINTIEIWTSAAIVKIICMY